MIPIVGGLNGFVGSNTAEALVELGMDCVLTKHKNAEIPRFLQKHIDDHHVFIEPADATSISDLRKIGRKQEINGIVNVAGGLHFIERGPGSRSQGYIEMPDDNGLGYNNAHLDL